MNPEFLDEKHEYNRVLRGHRRKKKLAAIGVLFLALALGLGFGCFVASLPGPNHWLAFVALGLLSWGAWGLHFICRRH